MNRRYMIAMLLLASVSTVSAMDNDEDYEIWIQAEPLAEQVEPQAESDKKDNDEDYQVSVMVETQKSDNVESETIYGSANQVKTELRQLVGKPGKRVGLLRVERKIKKGVAASSVNIFDPMGCDKALAKIQEVYPDDAN